jgi:hypothetical protein
MKVDLYHDHTSHSEFVMMYMFSVTSESQYYIYHVELMQRRQRTHPLLLQMGDYKCAVILSRIDDMLFVLCLVTGV